ADAKHETSAGRRGKGAQRIRAAASHKGWLAVHDAAQTSGFRFVGSEMADIIIRHAEYTAVMVRRPKCRAGEPEEEHRESIARRNGGGEPAQQGRQRDGS